MRLPSLAAKEQLVSLLLTGGVSPDQLRGVLQAIGANELQYDIAWTQSPAAWAREFVDRTSAQGFVDGAFVDLLGAVPNLVRRADDLDRLRVRLGLIPSPTAVVSAKELDRLSQLAREAHLGDPLPRARLGVTLPAALRRETAQPTTPEDQVAAWLEAANRQSPDDPGPRWLVELFRLALAERGVVAEPAQRALALLEGKGAVVAPTGAHLEQVIRENGILTDGGTFLARWREASSRVCAIFLAGRGQGTGFLVGPDLVLTNHHVLAPVLRGATRAEDVTFVFDFVSDGQQTSRGPTVVLADATGAGRPWLVDASPPTPKEAGEGTADDTTTCLDFVLVRVVPPEGWSRSPFRLSADHAFAHGDPILLLGHPGDGAGSLRPQAFSIETDSILESTPTRVRYRTNTLGGSSGSPVMTADWQLVALHHYGVALQYNQGIPMSAILARPAVAAAVKLG